MKSAVTLRCCVCVVMVLFLWVIIRCSHYWFCCYLPSFVPFDAVSSVLHQVVSTCFVFDLSHDNHQSKINSSTARVPTVWTASITSSLSIIATKSVECFIVISCVGGCHSPIRLSYICHLILLRSLGRLRWWLSRWFVVVSMGCCSLLFSYWFVKVIDFIL